jgi:hypothetical protein
VKVVDSSVTIAARSLKRGRERRGLKTQAAAPSKDRIHGTFDHPALPQALPERL